MSAPGKSFLLDDAITYKDKGVSYPPIPDEATAGMELLNATHADVDGDGRPELIVIGRVGPMGAAILRVNILTFVNSQWVKIGTFDCNSAGDHNEYETATVSAGDVDGDGREEIIVAGELFPDSWVRVYEDPIQGGGFGKIAHESTFRRPNAGRAIAAQLDDDGETELVIYTRPHQGTPAAYVFDDAQHGYAPLLSIQLFSANDISVELVALNRDGDAREEIAVVRQVNSESLIVQIYDDAIAGFPLIQSYDSTDSGNWSNPTYLRPVQAGDIDGDGVDELVVSVGRKSGSTYTIDLRVYWGNGTLTTTATPISTTKVLKSWDLALADRNSDGKMEIVTCCVVSAPGNTEMFTNVQEFNTDSPTKLQTSFTAGPFALAAPTTVVLAGDDFDMDGARIRWKGVKFLRLPDPTLMVVLAAPPPRKASARTTTPRR